LSPAPHRGNVPFAYNPHLEFFLLGKRINSPCRQISFPLFNKSGVRLLVLFCPRIFPSIPGPFFPSRLILFDYKTPFVSEKRFLYFGKTHCSCLLSSPNLSADRLASYRLMFRTMSLFPSIHSTIFLCPFQRRSIYVPFLRLAPLRRAFPPDIFGARFPPPLAALLAHCAASSSLVTFFCRQAVIDVPVGVFFPLLLPSAIDMIIPLQRPVLPNLCKLVFPEEENVSICRPITSIDQALIPSFTLSP